MLAKEFRAFVHGPREPWEGTATDLLEALNEEVEDKVQRRKKWPKTASALSGELRRLAPSLRAVGIQIEFIGYAVRFVNSLGEIRSNYSY